MNGSKSKKGGRARVYGSPGESPKLTGLMRIVWPLIVAFGLGGYLLRVAVPFPPLSPAVGGALLILLSLGLAAATATGRTRLSNYRKGARGEELVARDLSFLPDGYTVLHGPLAPREKRGMGGPDLDHVVLGPTGVFAVETKNWADPVTIQEGEVLYGDRKPDRPPLEQTRKAARRLKAMIGRVGSQEIPVTPILCFAANSLVVDSTGVGGVVVCNLRVLRAMIQEPCDEPLSTAVVRQIESVLRDRMPVPVE